MVRLDATHDLLTRSWVTSANGHTDFPIQNLPIGVFSSADDPRLRGGVAIGDEVLDVSAAVRAGLFTGDALHAATVAGQSTLNAFLAIPSAERVAFRARVFALLADGAPERSRCEPLLRHASECVMHLPVTVGDYTDFYAGIHHAMNVGKLFRPDQPLLPNYKHVPIGYHGRSSSIVVSGTDVRRPSGQRKAPADAAPTFGPCRNLDFELELGVWVGAGNAQGTSVAIGAAEEQVAGFCLLNDWSARDIQSWEYQPLGPFLAKSFATSVSAWIVTPEALAPFRIPQPARPDGDPAPLPYLMDAADQQSGALDVELEVLLLTAGARAQQQPPVRISLSNAQHLYWTVAQLIAHHTSNGCNLRPGDLLGTGTISAPTPDGLGSLLEMTQSGRTPIDVGGETRTFLMDGDEVIVRARARRDGYATIGFGDVRGIVYSTTNS